MALEFAPHNINVNVIQPGYIDTPGERVIASEDEVRLLFNTQRGGF